MPLKPTVAPRGAHNQALAELRTSTRGVRRPGCNNFSLIKGLSVRPVTKPAAGNRDTRSRGPP
jgi:hypothetical protein